MKSEGHPEYFEASVICSSCSTEFTVGSVINEIRVGVCGACHPFYTGKAKLLDSEGRVDQFQRKFGKFFEDKKKKAAAGKSEDAKAEPKVDA